MTDDERDTERVQDAAERRRRERAELSEHAARELEGYFTGVKYPVSSEELAAEYGEETIELPNETESLGSVFDRLADQRYETPAEVREAVHTEITGPTARPEEYGAELDREPTDADEPFEEDTSEDERRR